MKKLKITYNSPVVLTFTLIALAVLILSKITGGASNTRLFCVYRAPLSDLLFYVRLFTHVLGHSGIEHFVNNFTLILLLGPILEEKYGSFDILILMLTTALITGLINVIFFPSTALLGASGIVFMFIILASFTNNSDGTIPVTFLLIAVIYIGKEVVNAVFVTDQISQMAHIIGGACGAVAGHFLGKDSKPTT